MEAERDSCLMVERQIEIEQQQDSRIPFNSELSSLMRRKFAWAIQGEFYHKGTLGYFVKIALKPKQFAELIEGKIKFSSGQIYSFSYNGLHHKGHFVKV
jgi:hypothetical protein